MYKQPILKEQWNFNNFLQILYRYLRYTDKLLDVFFLLLTVILSVLHKNPGKKIYLQKKVHWKIIHMWRTWGTPQNFSLAFIDELKKTIY